MVAAAAGYEGMIGGQMADIASEGNRIALSRLEQLHLMKTGALINAAITTGAILGGGTSEQIRHLDEYAQNIGLAFQIIDDILNVEGDPALLGKAVGTDKEKKKSTYPALLGLDESRKLAANRVKEALQALEYFDKKADPLRRSHNMLSTASAEDKTFSQLSRVHGLFTIYLLKAAQPRFIKSGTDFIQELILF